MTTNWLGGTPTPSDPSTFNYDTAAQKLQRQRAAAQALQQLGMQSNQGQIIKGGDYTGFAGGNTVGSTLAHVLASYLGTQANSNADDQQNQLSKDSQAALSYAMDPKNTPSGQRAAAAAMAQNNTVQAGDQINPNASPTDQASPVETSSVAMPTTTVNPMAQAAAQALAPTANAAPSGQSIPSMPRPVQSVTGGPQSFGNAGLSRALAPPTNLPTGATGNLSPSDIALATQMFGGKSPSPTPAPNPTANAPVASPGVTSATGPAPTAPMSPPMPPHGQAPMPQPQAQAPMPAPQMAPAPMPQAQPQMTQPQAAPPANAQPTQAEQIAQLQAIARTGPLGQQMATAQMNAMFGSKNGRYKTTVMADPVNGGFVQVTEDTATGATQHQVIGGGGNTLVTGQTTDANGNRLNVHKDGSTTPMVDAGGKPVVDSSVVAKNDEHSLDVAGKHSSNAQAVSALQTQLANLNRMDALYDITSTGPVLGKLPAWNDNRNELSSLTGANNFAAVREAVDGAGGGTQRFTQSELQHFAGGNGGLSLDTRTGPAHNLIANQRALLTAKLNAIQAQDTALQGTGAGSTLPSTPARGQQVSAAQYGFK